MAQQLRPVDTSTIPELCGRFEPVGTEIGPDELTVDGSLPQDLTGAYVRNGPNPRFTPWAASRTLSRATPCCTVCGSRTAGLGMQTVG